MGSRQVSLQLATAILALATSLTFISSSNSDEQVQNAQNTVAQDEQSNPSALGREKKSIKIKFKVKENDDGGLQIESQDIDDCDSHSKGIGCFKIDRDKTGLIEFTLNANDHKQWKLAQLKICRGDSKALCNSDLTFEERLEFFVMDDPRAMGDQKIKGGIILTLDRFGRVYLTQLPENINKFYLYDQNSFEQTYFYNIEVCKDDGTCLTLDPPVENKG